LEQEIVSGSGIKSATRPRQTTTPTSHHSVFTGRLPFLLPNNGIKALKAVSNIIYVALKENQNERKTISLSHLFKEATAAMVLGQMRRSFHCTRLQFNLL